MQYEIPVGSGSVTPRIDGQYQSEIFTDANNSIWSRVEPRFLMNGKLTYRTGESGWEAALEVQNLLNKFYFVTVSDVTGGLGVQTGVPGMPRTWSVSVKKTF
jgi:iron complex outermembrane receptor protein